LPNKDSTADAVILIVIILVAGLAVTGNLSSGPTPVIMLLGGGDTQSGGTQTQVASTWGNLVVHF
jgi:hypothetical protein